MAGMSIQEACWRMENGGARVGAYSGLRRESEICTGFAVLKLAREKERSKDREKQ